MSIFLSEMVNHHEQEESHGGEEQQQGFRCEALTVRWFSLGLAGY
jgi:hypothetical protein